jgi:uncharacterized glyoxalase superfamily protein PhnB
MAKGDEIEIRSAAPVFQVDDVGETLRWYESNLGFRAEPFPDSPPYSFCILIRDQVEIMLQRVAGAAAASDATAGWHAYLRVRGVREYYDRLRQRPEVDVIDSLSRKAYGDSEFSVRDPNGYVLVFSELLDS